MQYKRLDPSRGLSDHIHELRNQLRANDTAPTGDVGLSGQIVATDPVTGVETIIGRLPDGSTGIQQWVNDTTPPGTPSTPSVAPTIGAVTVTWDGLVSGGTAQPADYDRTEIEYSTNGTIWAKGGTFTRPNSYTVPGLTIGITHSFRLISYDKNNNASPASAIVTATPVTAVDNPDIENALQTLRDKDTEIVGTVTTAQGDATQALDDALTAFNKAKSVPTTFYNAVRPAVDPERPFVVGDQWIDTNDSDKMYVWNGTDFILSLDPKGTVDSTLSGLGINQTWVNDIEAQADRAIDTFFGTTTPVGMQSGDLWLTGVAGEPMKRYNGTVWATFEDPNIQAAYTRAGEALTEADKKIRTFAQTTAPTGMVIADEGDLWINTSAGTINGQVKRWDGDSWELVIESGTNSANNALITAGLTSTWKNEIETQADRAITTFYGTVAPTGMLPGDLWLTGTPGDPMKRYTTVGWAIFEDPNVQAAYTEAGKALTEADKKIITYAQSTAPTGLTDVNAGDLWIDSDDGKVSRWQITTGTTYGWVQVVDNGASAADAALKTAEAKILDAAGLAASKGKVWFQNDAPVSGNSYAWTGTAHASVSTLKSNGVEVSRNLFPNPSFETNTTITGSNNLTRSLTTDTNDVVVGTNALKLVAIATGSSTYLGAFAAVTAGKTVTFGLNARRITGTGTHARMTILWRDAAGASIGVAEHKAIEPLTNAAKGQRLTHSAVAPTGAVNAYCLLYFFTSTTGGNPTIGDEWSTDAWIARVGDAVLPVSLTDYFDGSTNDDRANDLWVDTDDGNKPYRWDNTTDTWVVSTDQRILDAIDLANSAAKSIGFSGNPSFDDWTTTYPLGFTQYNTAPTKETATVRIPKNGARWAITAATQLGGLNFNGGTVAGHLPNLEYYTVELEFYLVSGTLSGAGVLLDWNGTNITNGRATLDLAAEFPNGVNIGKWHRVTKTLRRPTNFTGTWANMGGFLMANYTAFPGGGGSIKNIIFDWMNLRPATAEEITAFGTPAKLQIIDQNIAAKGKVIIQPTAPAVADQLIQNLWIDTALIGNPAAPGNIPKRWNSTTSTWDAVTEKAVIDAANAAAKAQGDATQAINDAGLATTAAGERSRIVHLNTTPPVPATGWKDGDVWYQHSTADIKSPIVDWYIWKTNTWELQELHESFLPLVNIGAGTYGTLRGNSFSARLIDVTTLIVSDFTNHWQNPDFEQDTVGQQAKGLTPNTAVLVISGGAGGSGKALSLPAKLGSSQLVSDTNLVTVQPGDQFLLSVSGKFANTVGTGLGVLGLTLYNASRVSQGTQTIVSFNTKNTVWERKEASYTVPAGTYFVQPTILFTDNGETTNAFHVDDIEVRRKNAGKLIVDGAFDARTITGALIQSMATTYRGIKLSANQLVAYDASGTAAGETFRIDGNTGAVTMKGDLTSGSVITGASINGATITGALIQTSTGVEKIQMDSTSMRAYNAVGVEYFSLSNGEVNLTGVTNTKGLTHNLYGNKPITTSVGNVGVYDPGSNTFSNLPGAQWQLIEDPDTMMSYPSIVSYSGKDLVLTGGVTPGTNYARVELWSDNGNVYATASDSITLQANKGIIHMFGNVEYGGTIDQRAVNANLTFEFPVGYGIQAPRYSTGTPTTPSVIMANWTAGTVQRPGIWLSRDGSAGGDEAFLGVNDADNLLIDPPTGKNTLMMGRLRLGWTTSSSVIVAPALAGLYFRNDGSSVDEKLADGAIWAPNGGNTMFLRAPSNAGGRGPIRIDSGTFFEIYDPPTSTFAANVGISTSPKDRIYKVSSAPKFKVNREMVDLNKAWSILNVVPSMWYDRTQIEEKLGMDSINVSNPDDPLVDPTLLTGLDLRKIPGVSAKDVEAAGLTEFVTYTANGEVEGVSYDRMWILLVPIIRNILERMAAMDKKPVTPSGPLKPMVDPKGARNK